MEERITADKLGGAKFKINEDQTAGIRTVQRHNPLVVAFAHLLAAAGRRVAVEQRDPSMGPNARLDIVVYVSDAGRPAA